MDEKQQKQAARNTRIRQGLGGAGAGVGLMAALGMMWWSSLNQTPMVKIPTPTMPHPNARDYFIRASNSLIDSDKASWALNRVHTGVKGDRPYSLQERMAIVEENRPALKILHEGFGYPYQELPSCSVGDQDFTQMARMRSVERFLRMAAMTCADQGDWSGALDYHMDAIQVGQMMPRGASLIGMLVGVAVRAIGAQGANGAIDHLNAAQARSATRRMERIIALHVPFADVVQVEEWTQQAYLLEMFRDSKWHQSLKSLVLPSDDDTEDKRNTMQKLKDEADLYLVNKREVMYHYTQYMNQVVANARLPYAAHPPDPPVPDDPVCKAMLIGPNLGRNKDVQMEAQEAQLCIRLAIQAYRMDHHGYPPALTALVPAYLSRLPDDPYAFTGSYGYQRDKNGYALTSGMAAPAH